MPACAHTGQSQPAHHSPPSIHSIHEPQAKARPNACVYVLVGRPAGQVVDTPREAQRHGVPTRGAAQGACQQEQLTHAPLLSLALHE